MKREELQRLEVLEGQLADLKAGVANGPPPPEIQAEIDGIIAKLTADVAEARAAGVELPPRFKGTPEQIIEQCFSALREEIEYDYNKGKWIRPRKKVPQSEKKAETDPLTAAIEAPARSLDYRLRCLQTCELGLGSFRQIWRKGQVWNEQDETRKVADTVEAADRGEQFRMARVIMDRWKLRPERGENWSVIDGG
jgi:hypothetical protein